MSDLKKLLYVGHTNPWGQMSGSGFSPRICNELLALGRLYGGIQPFDRSSLNNLHGKHYNHLLARARRKLEFRLRGHRSDIGLIESEAEGIMPEVLSRLEPGSPVFYHFHTPLPDTRFDHRRFLFQDLTPRDAYTYKAYGHEQKTAADIDRSTAKIREVIHAPTTAGVITYSSYAADSVAAEYDYPREKITAIGCGPIRSYWDAAAVSPDRYARAQILFVGRSWEHKAGDALIEAFKIVRAAIPHATLCIVGPREQPERTIDVPGVKYYGRISDAQVAALFAESSMFSMVPECETWGIVYSEAANAGLPIVGVAKWALPDIVVDGVTGRLVPEKRAEALAEAMIELLRDPDRMEQMGRAAHQLAEDVLDWPHVIGRLSKAVWPDQPEIPPSVPLQSRSPA